MYTPAYAVPALALCSCALILPADLYGWTFAMGRGVLCAWPSICPCTITHITRGIKQWSTRVLIPFVHAGNPSDPGEDLTVNNSAKVYMWLQALMLCLSLIGALFFLLTCFLKKPLSLLLVLIFLLCIFIIILSLAVLLLVRIKWSSEKMPGFRLENVRSFLLFVGSRWLSNYW